MSLRRSAGDARNPTLPAELLLHAVDPGNGGLLSHNGGRFRKALAVAGDPKYVLPGTGWLAAASRDWEVLVLLAWSGVLARRLNKDGRRMADRRVKQLFTASEAGVWGFPGAEYDVPAWVPRLEGPVVLDEEIDLFESPELVEFGHDHSGYSAFG